MFVSHRRGWRLFAALIVALALAGGPAACGDSDDDGAQSGTTAAAEREQGSSSGADGAAPGSDTGTDGSGKGAHDAPDARGDGGDAPDDPGGDEAEVTATVTGMYRSFAKGDAEGVCAAMSDAAREQIAQNVLGGSTEAPSERTCETSLSKFLDAAAASGILERTLSAQVDDVRVDGGIATATVSFGGASGKIRLLREDGEWRFGVSALSPGQSG